MQCRMKLSIYTQPPYITLKCRFNQCTPPTLSHPYNPLLRSHPILNTGKFLTP